MELHNSFEVPLPPAEAWNVLLDIPRIAPCMPGAELTEVVDDKTYKGKVSVRLGPVALAFQGTATFEGIDAQAHTAKVKAQGADTKGRGGANAIVTFGLEPAGAGSKVVVDTNLNLSGAVAQYGRGAGMIQAVAAQLIGQFAENLRAEIAASAPAPAPVAAPAGVAASQAAPAGADGGTAPSDVSTGAARAPAASASQRPAAKPISGFALLWAAFSDWVKGLFGGGRRG